MSCNCFIESAPFSISQILIFAILAAIGGVIGCFLNWNRMAGYCDNFSHGSIAGLSFAFAFNINALLCTLIFSLIFSFCAYSLCSCRWQIKESVLAILGRFFAAVGLSIAISYEFQNHNLKKILLGELKVSDAYFFLLMIFILLFSFIYIIVRRKKLILMTINKDIAYSEGINVSALQLEFNLIYTIIISFIVSSFGGLISVIMVVAPSAISRAFSKSVDSTLALSAIINFFSFIIAFALHIVFNIHISLMIAYILCPLFVISALKMSFLGANHEL